jgi:serine/threonine protein kinase
MENEVSVEKSGKFLDVSSDLSNKSFLISPLGQKMLLSLTFDIQGIYEHITRKDRRERLKNLLKCEKSLKQGRYTVKKLIGKGSFGSVIEAIDNSLETSVAVKIVKLKPGVTIHTNNEVINLKRLNQLDPEGSHFVKMLDFFEENGYLCIVLELLHKNLYQFLLELKGFSLAEIAPMAQQLFRALHILESANIVHCDLKPENIMIRGIHKKHIKVVDFGTSCEAGKSIYKFVQSRFYRAPEVSLRLEYSLPIDMWSAGCILAELYMGKPLFESHSENSQIVYAI